MSVYTSVGVGEGNPEKKYLQKQMLADLNKNCLQKDSTGNDCFHSFDTDKIVCLGKIPPPKSNGLSLMQESSFW